MFSLTAGSDYWPFAQDNFLIVLFSVSFPSGFLPVLHLRDAKDECLRPDNHHSKGAAGGEAAQLLDRSKPRKSGGVVRFSLETNETE